jgi:TonB family protein
MKYCRLIFCPVVILCAGYAFGQFPGPNDFVAVDKQPTALNLAEVRRSIVYPPAALDSGLTGKVFVRVLVDETGNVADKILVKSPHPLLSRAVEARIQDLKFSPALLNDKPVASWITIPFQFSIEEKKPLALDDRLPEATNLPEVLSFVKPPKGVPAPENVVVGVHVSQTGTPLEIRFPPDLAPEWKAALEKNIYDLRFRPAVVFDQPRAMWTDVKLDLTRAGKK